MLYVGSDNERKNNASGLSAVNDAEAHLNAKSADILVYGSCESSLTAEGIAARSSGLEASLSVQTEDLSVYVDTRAASEKTVEAYGIYGSGGELTVESQNKMAVTSVANGVGNKVFSWGIRSDTGETKLLSDEITVLAKSSGQAAALTHLVAGGDFEANMEVGSERSTLQLRADGNTAFGIFKAVDSQASTRTTTINGADIQIEARGVTHASGINLENQLTENAESSSQRLILGGDGSQITIHAEATAEDGEAYGMRTLYANSNIEVNAEKLTVTAIGTRKPRNTHSRVCA